MFFSSARVFRMRNLSPARLKICRTCTLEAAKGDGPFPTHQTRSGEAHRPDRKAACRWDRRHTEKTTAGPRERRAQVGTVGDRAARPREGVVCKTVICGQGLFGRLDDWRLCVHVACYRTGIAMFRERRWPTLEHAMYLPAAKAGGRPSPDGQSRIPEIFD